MEVCPRQQLKGGRQQKEEEEELKFAHETTHPSKLAPSSASSDKSTYSEITPSQGKQSAEEEQVDGSELVELKCTKEWVQRQLLEHETALHARQQDETDDKTQEEVNASILHLQSVLQELSTKRSVQELMLERLQCDDALAKFLFDFPDLDSTEEFDSPDSVTTELRPTDKEREKICEMVKKQNELVVEIGSYHKDIQDLHEKLEDVKQQSFEQQARNRELMTQLHQRKEKHQQRLRKDSNNMTETLEHNLEQVMVGITQLQHIFQALMVGSDVHWEADPDLKELMISLGNLQLSDS